MNNVILQVKKIVDKEIYVSVNNYKNVHYIENLIKKEIEKVQQQLPNEQSLRDEQDENYLEMVSIINSRILIMDDKTLEYKFN